MPATPAIPSTPVHHVGSPTQAGPLTIFPVWTDAPLPRRALRATLPAGAEISEMPDGPEVERLVVDNPTITPFMLTPGTVFDGGWQHRVLVQGVVVGEQMRLPLDVRCVEQRRWHGRERHAVPAKKAPLMVRGALRGIGHGPQAQRRSPKRADQHDVWSRVERYRTAGGGSRTGSLVEMTDRFDDLLRDVLGRTRVLPGQRGLVIGVGGHPALMEVFDHPATLARQWEGIITGVLADAELIAARPTPGHRARTFARCSSRRQLDPGADAGTAISAVAADDLVLAEGLVTGEGRLVHLSVLNVRHELVGAA